MYRNINYSFQEPKQKKIDFQAFDKLLEYTKQAHQNSQRHIEQPEYYEIEKKRNYRPNSLTQRIYLIESSQQYKRERDCPFKIQTFVKYQCFQWLLKQKDLENNYKIIQIKNNLERILKECSLQQINGDSNLNKNNMLIKECDQLREQLMNQKQINKENYEKNARNLQLQIEKLKYEIQEQKISQKEKQDEIDTLNLQLKQKQSQLDQFDNTIKQLKNEIQNLQNKHDIQYDLFIDELNNEIEILQQNYRKLYNDYQQYKQSQSQMYEQQTQVPYSIIQSQQQYIHQENQEINMLNLMIQQLQNENEKLKDDLFKQSRRTETWCCWKRNILLFQF
ncbi:unnamed protein product [Paramecium primaurelia]|uniref:Uncharacterized protein n=1 Tax=Paramecium primaurelia TaxID=5886 RepID=A0A8S1JVY9_PARPR|nr:unnamed protein product [Paramecium primaurelia]